MYEKEKDYQAEIDKSVMNGNYIAAAEAEQSRNEKIDGEKLPYKKTYKYTQNPAAVIPPSWSSPQSMGTDYMQQANDAYAQGNYNQMGQFVGMHNDKAEATGISEPVFNPLLYNDKYAGELRAQRKKIADYRDKGFSYDPNQDIQYQTVKKIKENEAQAAGRNMYAQLAAQNGGVLPADMAGMIVNTQKGIINQADAQIPELYRMAYEKWADGENSLYNQYGLLSDDRNFDFGEWNAGSNNFYNNVDREIADRQWLSQYMRGNYESDRDFEQSKYQFDKNTELQLAGLDEEKRQYNIGMDYQRARDIKDDEARRIEMTANIAMQMYDPKNGVDYAAALARAQQVVKGIYGTPDYAAEAAIPAVSTGGSVGSVVSGSGSGAKRSGSGAKSSGGSPAESAPAQTGAQENTQGVKKILVDGVGYVTPAEVEKIGVEAYFDANGNIRYRRA